MSYADAAELINDYLPDVKAGVQTAAVTRILENASAAIDSYCLRRSGYFARAADDAAAAPRKFYGDGTTFLELDPYVPESIENVSAPGTLTAPSYIEFERNLIGGLHVVDENQCLVLYPVCELWQSGVPYTVTAKWGFAAVPNDIAEAARQITVYWWQKQRGILGQEETAPNGFKIDRDFPPAAKTLLKRYIAEENAPVQKVETGAFFSTDFYC